MVALGVMDVFGFVGVVEALDVCLKTANVRFVESEKLKGGIVSVVIEGDVGAVTASMAAGVEAAKKIGGYKRHTIIARVDDQVEQMLRPKEISPKKAAFEESLLLEDQGIPQMERETSEFFEFSNEEDSTEGNEVNDQAIVEEELYKMSVPELRTIARQMNLKALNKDAIKRARKSELIESILLEHDIKE